MNYVKCVGLIGLAALALMGLGAGTASATTLEIGGVTQNGAITLTASLETGTSAIIKDTAGFSANTCTTSHIHGVSTPPYTGSAVTGDYETMTFQGCTRPVTVDNPGEWEVVYTSGTNGTVFVETTTVTSGSALGTLTCQTGSTTDVGTLTGVKSGHATLHINAVVNCGIIPSAKWECTYIVTSPTGLGVSA